MRFDVRTVLTAAVLAAAALNAPAYAETLEARSAKWHCDVVTTYSCQVQGCEPFTFDPQGTNPNDNDVDIDFTAKQYARQGWPVQTFNARVEGDITTFLLPEDTVYALVKNDGTEFLEVRSNGYWSMSSFGSCRPQ